MTARVLSTLAPVSTASDALSGINSGSNIADGEEFSASFLQQIKALQAQASKTTQPSNVLEKIADLIKGQGGQDFSALLGNSLPKIKKQEQDINLDETMTALQGILAQLDSLNADSALPADLATKLELGTMTGSKEVASLGQGIQSSANLVTQTSVPLSDTKVVSTDQSALVDDKAANTLDLASNKQVTQGDLVDVQHEPINIPVQQAQIMSETDKQAVAKNVQEVIPQLLKQEKSYVQSQPSDELNTKEINLHQLLTREKKINKDTDFTSLVSANKAEKIVDSALLSTSQSVSEQANKFSTTDLMSLSRQVEGSGTKQELPPMTKPFNHPEWKQEFNERIVWMHQKSIPSAQLHLNPQSLGPISIHINVDKKDQQASIVFHAQQAGVREVIEASIPKLREMLNAQQVNLAEVNVSQQQQQGQGNARQAMQEAMVENNRNNTGNSINSPEIEADVNDIAEEIKQGRAFSSKGLLSIYA